MTALLTQEVEPTDIDSSPRIAQLGVVMDMIIFGLVMSAFYMNASGLSDLFIAGGGALLLIYGIRTLLGAIYIATTERKIAELDTETVDFPVIVDTNNGYYFAYENPYPILITLVSIAATVGVFVWTNELAYALIPLYTLSPYFRYGERLDKKNIYTALKNAQK